MYYYVDHTSRFARNTGIQRCVRAVARALLDQRIPLVPLVWNRDLGDFALADSEALAHLAGWSGPKPSDWATVDMDRPVEQTSLPWLLIVELVSGPYQPSAGELYQAATRRGWRVAWVFHDAIPLRHAQLYGARSELTAAYHSCYMRGLAGADLVLANSRTTAGHLQEFLETEQLPRAHVQALPLPCEFPGVERILPSTELAASSPQRLLCVGSLEPRKNHNALLKALTWMAAQDAFNAELVLVGWPNDARVVALVRRTLLLGLPVRWEEDADDARLRALLAWCDATVVASLEEGFGLPVAESLWHGKPCLCSDQGALGELSEGGGCYPLQVTDWRVMASQLQHWLGDPQLRRITVDALRRRSLRSWADYAQELLTRLQSSV